MNDHDMELDLEYLREKLALLEEPELPSSLSAAALFQRMDEGTLSLPEEEAGEETAPIGESAQEDIAAPALGEKVIPWKKLLKRGIPLAACLTLVLVLYQGHEVGMAKNFTSNAAPAASSAPAAREVPADAAYDTDGIGESASDNGAEDPSILRTYQSEDAADMPEEATANSVVSSSQEGAPIPEPSPAEGNTTKGELDNGTGKTEGSNDMAADTTGGEGEMAPMHPDVGGVEPEEMPMHPDSGGPGLDANPDVGADDPYSEAIRSRDKAIEAQALEIAAQYAPEEGLIPKWSSWGEEGDQVEFTIIYRDPEEHPMAQYHFDFQTESVEGSDVPRLVLLSFHREEITTYRKK